MGLERGAQWAKHLPHKCEEWRSAPQNPCKWWVGTGGISVLRGRGRGTQSKVAGWGAQLASSGFKWETLPQCVRWIIIWKTSEANLVSTCMHAHMCTHTGKHESTHACILHICVYTCKISWTEKGGVYHTLEDSHHLSKPTEVSANWFKNTFMVIFLTCLTKCLEAMAQPNGYISSLFPLYKWRKWISEKWIE